MNTRLFFEESKEQSLVKATIVAKYFWAWAKVIIPSARKQSGRIAYIDLFAGPGRYKDGTKSTPLLVLERAIQDPEMLKMIVTIFNDADGDNSRSLETEIKALRGIDALKHAPQIYNATVGEEIIKLFEEMHLVPTFFFVDPWGYKGLSLRLVNSVLKDWGCDCIFFFNYNRINMGLPNKAVDHHMNALFGEERAENLRQKLLPMYPYERELTVVEEIAQALKEMGGNYVLPFCFKNDKGNRTMHHLIFVSKHFKGYEIMKEIMAGESSKAEQGVPSFEYSPASNRQQLLFELSRPLDDLKDLLLTDFAGQMLTMEEIYKKHSVGRRYIKKNYKEALAKLEKENRIVADPPAVSTSNRKGRKKNTFAESVRVSFPLKVIT
ncbi:MAG: three-Cys-motif partner protein TcmP [Deltaproteobacteria bacterium]|nr:three-Cys-motif partner protein TcmP [Deltaproteobacteria bacterium]